MMIETSLKRELKESGNSEAVFDYKRIGAFKVTVYDALFEMIEMGDTSKETID